MKVLPRLPTRTKKPFNSVSCTRTSPEIVKGSRWTLRSVSSILCSAIAASELLRDSYGEVVFENIQVPTTPSCARLRKSLTKHHVVDRRWAQGEQLARAGC